MADVSTFLMFDTGAVEAARLYTELFGGEITSTVPGPEGRAAGAVFTMLGRTFMAYDGGTSFHFTEGISLFVEVDTQEELDRYWSKLTGGGGKEVQCGWLTDRFGVSWQIVPRALLRMLQDGDRAKAGRARDAMLKMVKLDIAALQRAFDGA